MEQLIIGVFEQGFIYAIMALGVYITYKILDFPDLSVDSTFPLGAAVTTVMLSSGKNPLLALIAATAAGAIAGMVTGIIHVKFKVRDLLSGIIVMTGLYTLNLRIVGGSANVPLFNYKSVFDNDFINGIFPEALAPYKTVIIIFIIMIISMVFFFFIRVDTIWLRIVLRLLFLPLVAGVSYEFIRLAGSSDHPLVQIFSKPGLALQKLTTKEPDHSMIEVAIASVEGVFDWREYLENLHKGEQKEDE